MTTGVLTLIFKLKTVQGTTYVISKAVRLKSLHSKGKTLVFLNDATQKISSLEASINEFELYEYANVQDCSRKVTWKT